MGSVRKIQELSEQELRNNVPESASWHSQYADSSYVYIGGLPFELQEEDVIVIFSQYGVPNDIKLVRDRETGESKGFCFLGYEDQRSTVLAVDNLNGIKLLDRTVKVDHCHYRPFTSDDPEELAREREYKEKMQKLLRADGPGGAGQGAAPKQIEHRGAEAADADSSARVPPHNASDDEFADPMASYIAQRKAAAAQGSARPVSGHDHDRRAVSPNRTKPTYRSHRE